MPALRYCAARAGSALMPETPGWSDLISSDLDQLVSSYLHRMSAELISRAPSSSPTDLMTLHASSLSYFQQTAEVAKVGPLFETGGRAEHQVLEMREGSDGLTEKAVRDRLLQN